MGHYSGRVSEVRLEAGGQMNALISCPLGAIPNPGQYVVAADPGDAQAALGTALFCASISSKGFWAAPPIPVQWHPGTILELEGPFGHGFELPKDIQRLGLVALSETVSRLMPLVEQVVEAQAGITLFADLPLPALPTSIEAYPLATLAEVVDWPDFLAFDLPLWRLPDLRNLLGLSERDWLPCPAQALVEAPMPCAGMALCGACAVPARRGWKLACEDGPVFDLKALKW